MLLLSSHLDSNWYFQRQHTGMSNGNGEICDFPVTCISTLYGEMNTSFSLCSLQSSSPRDSTMLKKTANASALSFSCLVLISSLLISMLQHSTLDRRKGKKEDLLPMKASCMWLSPITDLLRNWHDLPVDIRQLWSLPSFSVQSVWNSPLSYSFPWLWSTEPNSHPHLAHI